MPIPDKDRILSRLERGDITAADAVDLLAADGEEPNAAPDHNPPDHNPPDHNPPDHNPPDHSAPDTSILTRRERLDTLQQQTPPLEPHLLAALPGQPPRPWPWPKAQWQWIWQDAARPQHVDHGLETAAGSQLAAVLYDGDLRCGPAAAQRLGIGAAAFDIRLGQDGGHVHLAASGGSLDLDLPPHIAQLDVQALPGDLSIEGLELQRLRGVCHSGACRIRHLKGDLDLDLRGSDAVIDGLDGALRVRATRGRVQAKNLRSPTIDIEADEGIDLALGRVSDGHIRCVVRGGDLDITLAAAAAVDLAAETTDGGVIAHGRLPWSALHERSAQRLKGSLGGGGARLELLAHGGRIHIDCH